MNPVVSLICPSIRPLDMIDCYLRWCHTSLPFEIIFLGPYKPPGNLPSNFKFVETKVKPVQASAFGCHIAKGELLSIIADDLLLANVQDRAPLNVMYDEWNSYNNYKILLSLSPYVDLSRIPADNLKEEIQKRRAFLISRTHKIYVDAEPNEPKYLVCVGGLFSKKFYEEIGGPDNRFLTSQADIEMYRRMVLAGGEVKFSDIEWDEIKAIGFEDTRFNGLFNFSRQIIYETCIAEKNKTPRLFEINETILTHNQGNAHKFWPDNGIFEEDLNLKQKLDLSMELRRYDG